MKILTYLLVSCVAILSPIKPLMLTIGFLIMVDFIFAVYKAYKLKEKITSRKMGSTIPKIVLYNLSIMSVYFLNKYIFNTDLPLEKIVAGLIAVVEIKSIDESFKQLFGYSFWAKLKKIINRGTSTTKDLLD